MADVHSYPHFFADDVCTLLPALKAGEEINLIAIDGLVSGLANCNESVAYFGGTANKFLFS